MLNDVMYKPRLLNPDLYTFSTFTWWKSIIYYRLCRDRIFFDKILVSEYKLFKRPNTSSAIYLPKDNSVLRKWKLCSSGEIMFWSFHLKIIMEKILTLRLPSCIVLYIDRLMYGENVLNSFSRNRFFLLVLCSIVYILYQILWTQYYSWNTIAIFRECRR
jgi:hypothetical protein